MISVIICSINKGLAQQVQKNIAATIGVVWELIVIENTIAPKSITEVYNLGASRAQYDILLFVHEDVLFQTKNWGEKLIDCFRLDSSLGLIGVAGSKYKSITPSGWFTGFREFDCCNIIHSNNANGQVKIYYNPSPQSTTQQVKVLDGVFLCATRKVWTEIRFDDILLRDFHLYDLDFSFRAAEKYKVIVTFDIEILHIAKGGHYGNKWLESTLIWHKKVQEKLPAFFPELKLDKRKVEKKILKTWLIRLKHEDISFYNKINWLCRIKIWFHISAWPFVFLFLVKSIFKKK